MKKELANRQKTVWMIISLAAPFGVLLSTVDDAQVVLFNAKSESDRLMFSRDLHECILEVFPAGSVLNQSGVLRIIRWQLGSGSNKINVLKF